MGVLARFKSIMDSNINALLDKMEDPSKMIDQTLRELNESLTEVKKETAGVMAEEKRCKRNMDDAEAEVKKWQDLAMKAVQSGNDADAKVFLGKKQAAESNFASTQNTYALAKSNADKMKQMHDKLCNDISILESKKDDLKAKAAVAKTQEKVNQVNNKHNMDGALASFDRMEARINKRLDTAMAEAELNSQPADTAQELADKYTSGQNDASVDAELAALKASMGMSSTSSVSVDAPAGVNVEVNVTSAQ